MHLKLIFRSADLTCVNGSRIQLVLNANFFLGLTYGFLNKNFQEIKLYIIIALAQNTIVRLQSQIVRFSETLQTGLVTPILELKLKCCFCTCSVELLFIFLFITCHSRILRCASLFPQLVPWIPSETAYEWSLFSVVCLQLHILAEKVSLSKIWKSCPLF